MSITYEVAGVPNGTFVVPRLGVNFTRVVVRGNLGGAGFRVVFAAGPDVGHPTGQVLNFAENGRVTVDVASQFETLEPLGSVDFRWVQHCWQATGREYWIGATIPGPVFRVPRLFPGTRVVPVHDSPTTIAWPPGPSGIFLDAEVSNFRGSDVVVDFPAISFVLHNFQDLRATWNGTVWTDFRVETDAALSGRRRPRSR